MFSERLKNKFNELADDKKLITSSAVEGIIKDFLGYPFSRKLLQELIKNEDAENLSHYSVVSINNWEEVGQSSKFKRKKFKYGALIDVLEYLMVCESITGMIRGNVVNNRKNAPITDRRREIALAKILSGIRIVPADKGEVALKQIVYTADMRAEKDFIQKQVQKGQAEEKQDEKDIPDFAPSDYNPTEHKKWVLPFNSRLIIAYFFITNWLSDDKNPDFDFYRDWRIFRERVLAEDSLDIKDSDGNPIPFNDKTVFQIPYFNRYIANRQWKSNGFEVLNSISSMTRNSSGASLRDSIAVLDAFVRTASNDDYLKLRDWMEIILVFENGSGWVVDEAKAALKLHVPSLDQESLIDDWWMLSIIYLGLNGGITKK